MNRNWATIPATGNHTRDYTDPAGPVPTVTATIARDGDQYLWHLVVIGANDKWGNPTRTLIARGETAATPHALPVLKARLTRLGRAAAHLERETATAAALAALNEAIAIAGDTPVERTMSNYMRRCAWERDTARARYERLAAAS